MAMRVKHVQRAPSLAQEIELTKQYNESAPVEIVVQIERYITRTGDGRYLIGDFSSSWNTVSDNKSLNYSEDNYRYYYKNGDFRRYMHREVVCLKNYIKRLKKEYSEVNVFIMRTYTEFRDYD